MARQVIPIRHAQSMLLLDVMRQFAEWPNVCHLLWAAPSVGLDKREAKTATARRRSAGDNRA